MQTAGKRDKIEKNLVKHYLFVSHQDEAETTAPKVFYSAMSASAAEEIC
jgi:hypothetical protein